MNSCFGKNADQAIYKAKLSKWAEKYANEELPPLKQQNEDPQ